MTEKPGSGQLQTGRPVDCSGRTIRDIRLNEGNEAFAPVPPAWLQENGADRDRLNVNGGATAVGYPLGSSGLKLMATLVHALRARGKWFGLQTMCEAGASPTGQSSKRCISR